MFALRPSRAMLTSVALALVVAAGAAHAAQPLAIVVTGRAGAGKGTTAGALAKRFGVKKWSSGDVFRAEAKKELLKQGITREPLPAEVSREAALALADGDESFGAKMAHTILAQHTGGPIIVEGFRSPEAVAGFRSVLPDTYVFALQVSAKRRHEAVLKVRAKQTAAGGNAGEGARPGEDAKAMRARDRADGKLGVGRLIADPSTVRIRPRFIDPDDYPSIEDVQAAIAAETERTVDKIITTTQGRVP